MKASKSVISQLLSKSEAKERSKNSLSTVDDLFNQNITIKPEEPVKEPKKVDPEQKGQIEAEDDGIPFQKDENLSAFQIKERNERTVFVGNIPLDAEKKEIQKFFKSYGKIENLWIRSLPVLPSKSLPVKASVILKKFQPDINSKNCYILFSTKEEAEKVVEANGVEFKSNHLRIDWAGKKENDYQTTVFIGNLPFNANEEELRSFFSDCGKILNVRIIRDQQTHLGKGFGYVTFNEKEGLKSALAKADEEFKGRKLRIKKAVKPERLEKKKIKKAFKEQEKKSNALRRLERKKQKGDAEDEGNDEGQEEDEGDVSDENDDISFSKQKTKPHKFDVNRNELEDVVYKNQIKMPPRLMRKKIKKVKGGTKAKFRAVQRLKTQFTKSNDKNIFNNVNEREVRKEKRKKKLLANIQKSKMTVNSKRQKSKTGGAKEEKKKGAKEKGKKK